MSRPSSLKLFVHVYCPSSFRVVRYLINKGLLDLLEVIPLNTSCPVSLSMAVPSVPALAIGDRVVAVDPLEPEFIEGIVLGSSVRNFVPVTDSEIIERFVNSVKSSSFVMLYVALGGLRLDGILRTDFVEASTRTYFSGLSGGYIRELILAKRTSIETDLSRDFTATVARSFLRDFLISYGPEAIDLVDARTLKLWATAKLSQGIAYTPLQSEIPESKLREVLAYLNENYDRLVKHIENYLAQLKSEPEVHWVLTRGTLPR